MKVYLITQIIFAFLALLSDYTGKGIGEKTFLRAIHLGILCWSVYLLVGVW